MSDDGVFTDFVRELGPSATEIPSEVVSKFRKLLRGRLRRRGLFNAPPSLLGYAGSSWQDNATLDDLVADCLFDVIFGKGKKQGQQLLFLKTQVAAGHSIDALVSQSISHYMHDLHRQHFPRDYAIYRNLSKSVTGAVEKPKAVLSQLSDEPLGTYGRVGETGVAVSLNDLSGHIRSCDLWGQALPRLTRQGKEVITLTVAAIEGLPKAGKTPFLFQDLHSGARDIALEQLLNAGETVREADQPESFSWSDVFPRTKTETNSYSQEENPLAELVEVALSAINRAPRREAIREKMRELVQRIADQIRLDGKFSQVELARELNLAPQTLNDYLRFIRQACQGQS